MPSNTANPRRGWNEDAIIRAILEDTAAKTGHDFFAALVASAARVLDTHGAWVTEYSKPSGHLRALAFWLGGKFVSEYEYEVSGTPCETVVTGRQFLHVPERVIEVYPDDPDLRPMGGVSYMGAPMLDATGEVMGHFAVLDTKPMPEEPGAPAIFRLFAARAAAELQRIRAKSQAGDRRRAEEGSAEIVTSSAAMQEVLEDVGRVAVTNAPVLIQGETGTGKELIAKAIHAQSHRKKKALVTVNCAAVPASLTESEFFGHEKGAFTGATDRRQGRFARADGGTLFLDEVGELPLDLQPKLLRVLQEGEFEPVGSARTTKVDVRILAATNRDLKAEVEAGRFRADLYYRLGVFPIHIPPLRDRKEDIPLLAQSFAERSSRRLNLICPRIDADAFAALESYPWPGNVRELSNVIERALIGGGGERLDLARALPEMVPSARNGPDDDDSTPDRIWTAQELRELERRNLLRALETADWRVSGAGGAAELLGMNPSTLSSRMKALGIERP